MKLARIDCKYLYYALRQVKEPNVWIYDRQLGIIFASTPRRRYLEVAQILPNVIKELYNGYISLYLAEDIVETLMKIFRLLKDYPIDIDIEELNENECKITMSVAYDGKIRYEVSLYKDTEDYPTAEKYQEVLTTYNKLVVSKDVIKYRLDLGKLKKLKFSKYEWIECIVTPRCDDIYCLKEDELIDIGTAVDVTVEKLPLCMKFTIRPDFHTYIKYGLRPKEALTLINLTNEIMSISYIYNNIKYVGYFTIAGVEECKPELAVRVGEKVTEEKTTSNEVYEKLKNVGYKPYDNIGYANERRTILLYNIDMSYEEKINSKFGDVYEKLTKEGTIYKVNMGYPRSILYHIIMMYGRKCFVSFPEIHEEIIKPLNLSTKNLKDITVITCGYNYIILMIIPYKDVTLEFLIAPQHLDDDTIQSIEKAPDEEWYLNIDENKITDYETFIKQLKEYWNEYKSEKKKKEEKKEEEVEKRKKGSPLTMRDTEILEDLLKRGCVNIDAYLKTLGYSVNKEELIKFLKDIGAWQYPHSKKWTLYPKDKIPDKETLLKEIVEQFGDEYVYKDKIIHDILINKYKVPYDVAHCILEDLYNEGLLKPVKARKGTDYSHVNIVKVMYEVKITIDVYINRCIEMLKKVVKYNKPGIIEFDVLATVFKTSEEYIKRDWGVWDVNLVTDRITYYKYIGKRKRFKSKKMRKKEIEFFDDLTSITFTPKFIIDLIMYYKDIFVDKFIDRVEKEFGLKVGEIKEEEKKEEEYKRIEKEEEYRLVEREEIKRKYRVLVSENEYWRYQWLERKGIRRRTLDISEYCEAFLELLKEGITFDNLIKKTILETLEYKKGMFRVVDRTPMDMDVLERTLEDAHKLGLISDEIYHAMLTEITMIRVMKEREARKMITPPTPPPPPPITVPAEKITTEQYKSMFKKMLDMSGVYKLLEIYSKKKYDGTKLTEEEYKVLEEFLTEQGIDKSILERIKRKGLFDDIPEFLEMLPHEIRERKKLVVNNLLKMREDELREEYPYVDVYDKILIDLIIRGTKYRTERYKELYEVIETKWLDMSEAEILEMMSKIRQAYDNKEITAKEYDELKNKLLELMGLKKLQIKERKKPKIEYFKPKKEVEIPIMPPIIPPPIEYVPPRKPISIDEIPEEFIPDENWERKICIEYLANIKVKNLFNEIIKEVTGYTYEELEKHNIPVSAEERMEVKKRFFEHIPPDEIIWYPTPVFMSALRSVRVPYGKKGIPAGIVSMSNFEFSRMCIKHFWGKGLSLVNRFEFRLAYEYFIEKRFRLKDLEEAGISREEFLKILAWANQESKEIGFDFKGWLKGYISY